MSKDLEESEHVVRRWLGYIRFEEAGIEDGKVEKVGEGGNQKLLGVSGRRGCRKW